MTEHRKGPAWLVWDDGFCRKRENVTILSHDDDGVVCEGKDEEGEKIVFSVNTDRIVLIEDPH